MFKFEAGSKVTISTEGLNPLVRNFIERNEGKGEILLRNFTSQDNEHYLVRVGTLELYIPISNIHQLPQQV